MPVFNEGFPSVPLRRHRPAQERNTTASYRQTETRRPVNRQAHKQPVQVDNSGYPIEDEDVYYQPATATPKSARRYTDEYGREVRQQGNRRVVIKDHPQRRIHWLLPTGVTMLVMLVLFVGGSNFLNWWSNHQLDSQYNFPRIWETDQVLDIDHDSASHKSHLIFQNLDGHVFFVVIPAGDISQAKLYNVTTLYGDNAASVPITADFRDINHDGKRDIVINLGDQGTIIFLNDGNNGFKPQSKP